MKKYIRITQLSEELGLSVKEIRRLQNERKIPFIKAGHRTLLFEVDKVRAALEKFEVKAIG